MCWFWICKYNRSWRISWTLEQSRTASVNGKVFSEYAEVKKESEGKWQNLISVGSWLCISAYCYGSKKQRRDKVCITPMIGGSGGQHQQRWWTIIWPLTFLYLFTDLRTHLRKHEESENIEVKRVWLMVFWFTLYVHVTISCQPMTVRAR